MLKNIGIWVEMNKTFLSIILKIRTWKTNVREKRYSLRNTAETNYNYGTEIWKKKQ